MKVTTNETKATISHKSSRIETTKIVLHSSNSNPFQITNNYDDSVLKNNDESKEKETRRITSTSTRVKDILPKVDTNPNEIKNKKDMMLKRNHEVNDLINESSDLNDMIHNLENYIQERNMEESKSSNKRVYVRDMIDEKRQLFLLKMSIQMKQQEIQKLDDRLKAKIEALNKSEEVLEEDAFRFDAFLKQNNKKAQEAIRMAETETKKKVDALHDVKRMHQEVQSLQTSINKHTRNLEEYVKYGKFLDQFIPEEWFEMQRQIQSNRKKERREKRIEARKERWKKEQEELEQMKILESQNGNMHPEEDESLPRRQKMMTTNSSGGTYKKQHVTTTSASASDTQEDPTSTTALEPDFEDEPLTSDSDEDTPMYFTSPQQLLDKFSAMEEEILFLIQNVQEAEQSLDEMTSRLHLSMAQAQKKADLMQSHISEIKNDIEERKKSINEMDDLFVVGDHKEKKDCNDENQNMGTLDPEPQWRQQDFMNKFMDQVKQLYIACGYTCVGSTTTPSLLFMLSQIETSIDMTMEQMEKIPTDKLKIAMKTKEKMRRERDRLQKQEELKKMQEERNKKVLERSLQPSKKPEGKKIMYRSYLIEKNENTTNTSTLKNMEQTHEYLLEKKFLTTE